MKKEPIWKNLVLIISILVVIVIATLAWFTNAHYGLVTDMSMNVGNSSYILISGDGGQWAPDLEVDLNIKKEFKEISGNGINFFKPVYDFVEKPDGSYVQELLSFDTVEEDDEYYFDQTYAFKTDADYEVYLSPESGVFPVDGKENGFIQGAVRVAFFEIDDNNNEILKCVWAPNSKLQYSKNSNSFLTDGNVEDNYYYQLTDTVVDKNSLNGEENTDVVRIPTNNAECGYDEENKFMWSNGNQLPENNPLLMTIKLEDNKRVQYKKMKVRVWLEGHDRECVSLLNGKEFTMKFKFDANRGE